MTSTYTTLVRRSLLVALLAGVTGAMQGVVAQTPNTPPRPATAAAPAKPPAPSVTLTTKPNPPVAGQTTFTVTVKDPAGQPVTGADVSVELVMPAMPAMSMAEMRNKIALTPATDPKLAAAGTYTGAGPVMMAGKWNATVAVKVGGKDYAELKLPLTAR